MKKLVAVLFGLLVVAAGFVAATQWEVTAVHQRHDGEYGWAYAEVGVRYDVQHPYTNYGITYTYGTGGLTTSGQSSGYLPIVIKETTKDPRTNQINGLTTYTYVVTSSNILIEKVTASAGWPYL